MTGAALRIERRGQIVILENTDAPRSRMTFEYMDELEAAVIDLRTGRGVRAIVITASGDEHFSVGMDLKQLMAQGAPLPMTLPREDQAEALPSGSPA
jgi:enoyl-CoA hydratase